MTSTDENEAVSIESPTFTLLPKIINGSIAGVVGTTCIFPLDLVKTRLQSQQIGPNGEKMYKSILDCFKKTIRSEGFFGMYRGSAVNIILVTPEKTLKLVANDYFRHRFTTSDGQLVVSSQMLAGGLAGLFQTIVTTPMELLKIQGQTAGRSTTKDEKLTAGAEKPTTIVKKASASKIAVKLLREKGIFGLYRGIGPTILRDVTFSMFYFPLFATLNELGPRTDGDEAAFYVSFASGCASGAVSALGVTPFDVIKTRLQVIDRPKGEMQFNGIIDCIRKTLKHEGPLAFFKGGLCRMMVIAPLFGIVQTVYFLGIGETLLGAHK